MPLLVLALLLATPPPKIAVLDVRLGAGVDAGLGPYLTQVLAKEVAERTGAFPLVSADVTAMLGFERTRQTLGCAGDDSQCLAELTAALGVQQVVTASVALSEGRYLVTASLIDTRRAQPLKRFAESAPSEQDDLVRTARRGAWTLFGGTEPGPAAPPPPRALGRRGWALVAGAGAIVLAGTGALVGANALSAAREGAPTARPRAHLADLLFAGALVGAGVGTWLWISGKPALASVAVAPAGALASLRLAW